MSASIGNRKWLFCLAVAAAAALPACWPGALPQLRYERTALQAGEWWRIFSAHLVHLNAAHLALNLAGLFLICELLWFDLPLRHGLGLLMASAAGVSAMLWWLHPALGWYAGLSGALHGLWAGCALAGWRDRAAPAVTARTAAAALLLLTFKLVSEWHFGAAAGVEEAIGGPVITAAHLYGALSGLAYALLWRMLPARAMVTG